MSEVDIAKMSNQERLNAFGYEEANKYHGPYERREPLRIYPSVAPEGASIYKQNEWLKSQGQPKLKTPREFVIPALSYKKFRPEKPEQPLTFKKKDIKCSKNRRKRASGGL